MSNKPMIKSWTGGMVEARVGMVVSTDKFSGNFKKATIVELHDDKSASLTVEKMPITHRVWLNTCTMLSCPFVVGDEYHVYREGLCGFEDRWVKGQVIETQHAADAMNAGKFMMPRRHANPDLRTSPDYEVNV